MSTKIRPEISKRKPYYISKHRFYELKHFCLQYKEWKKELNDISIPSSNSLDGKVHTPGGSAKDPVLESVMRRELLTDKIHMVRKAAKACSEDLGIYVLKGVTEEVSYERLVLQNGIPCCKETYYEAFRKFFFILSKLRK